MRELIYFVYTLTHVYHIIHTHAGETARPPHPSSTSSSTSTTPSPKLPKKGVAVSIHGIAHAESWAIDLMWDLMLRYMQSLPLSLPPSSLPSCLSARGRVLGLRPYVEPKIEMPRSIQSFPRVTPPLPTSIPPSLLRLSSMATQYLFSLTHFPPSVPQFRL
jgi:hypothetical protein